MVAEGPEIPVFSYLRVIDKALASNPLRHSGVDKILPG